VGGGTTAVEAKLLGRRCIARDINPQALEHAKKNLNFKCPELGFCGRAVFEPDVAVGDARNMFDIASESIDLICAHPPYAGIIGYSSALEGDLSQLSLANYLDAMRAVASECYRVLKPGRQCGVLIGDTRQKKRVVPIGFEVIRLFLEAGFQLRELVIKRQHNCKTTGFWYANSIKHNFFLLAHEYLPVFEKPSVPIAAEESSTWSTPVSEESLFQRIEEIGRERLETTTVWLFAAERADAEIRRNLSARFAGERGHLIEVPLHGGPIEASTQQRAPCSVALVPFPKSPRDWSAADVDGYTSALTRLAGNICGALPRDAVLVVEVRDVRVNAYVQPLALLAYEGMKKYPMLRLREIVVVATEGIGETPQQNVLTDVHRYLLIFERA